ncbi:threonine/serine exporter family protein [Oceanobacillus sp. FSL H7-0719]|uniref:threonine/serine exporter family protein n=1 Tax=Oceanobacillus sp. FSL H7-0719 TaxID=2954507 RepID=UPI0032518D06
MSIIAQLVTSFIASSGFGVLFGAPVKSLLQCGFVGMSGWIFYYFLSQDIMDVVPATILAAILVSILSYTCSKIYKVPIIIFNISGIIPLVPGGMAYNAMRHFVENDYATAVELSAQVVFLAGGIALGLMFSEVVKQISNKLSFKR